MRLSIAFSDCRSPFDCCSELGGDEYDQTYSEVAQSSVQNLSANAVIPEDTIKTVAKEIAAEEVMSRNVMVFGLNEEDYEKLYVKIRELFEDLGGEDEKCFKEIGKEGSQPVCTTSESNIAKL